MLSSSGSTLATIAAYESKAIERWFVDVGGEQTTGAGAKIGADQIERFAPVSVTEYLLHR
jgi:hypothetical protein